MEVGQGKAEEKLREVSQQLEGAPAGGEVVVRLTPDQVAALKSALDLYRDLKGVVRLGGHAGRFTKWFLLIGAGWVAFKAGLLEWLLLQMNGGVK